MDCRFGRGLYPHESESSSIGLMRIDFFFMSKSRIHHSFNLCIRLPSNEAA
jgi:hypothetical protein